MRTLLKRCAFIGMSLTLFAACETKQNLDDMHDATVEMNDTTLTMSKNTTDMTVQTGELYDALRQGEALSSRRKALETILRASDPAHKLSESAKYFMAYEFQLWTDFAADAGKSRRDYLATCAAQEFMKDVQQFIPGMDLTPRPLAGQILSTEKSNLVNSLNSLAVTMHYLNPKQEARLRANPEMTPLSMYTLIEKSFDAKNAIENGEKSLRDYPGYVMEILANESIAVYLLEARYNYLMALFLARSTNIAHSKIAAARVLMTDWTLDLSTFNVAQMEELKMMVHGTLQTKHLLLKSGVQPRSDKMLVRIFNNMILDSTKKATSAEKVALDQEVLEGLKELRQF